MSALDYMVNCPSCGARLLDVRGAWNPRTLVGYRLACSSCDDVVETGHEEDGTPFAQGKRKRGPVKTQRAKGKARKAAKSARPA